MQNALFLKKAKALIRSILWIPKKARFRRSVQHLKGRQKILYTLTPPSSMKNIGDHAQAIAIRKWFAKHFPDLPIVELDKRESREFVPILKGITTSNDFHFLHSGGNMGDRGIWSESIRRLLIQALPHVKTVSLPQTIYFSDTPTGRRERETTRKIYATHPDLTVIGRDPESGLLARELFPNATTFCMPDFVLSLNDSIIPSHRTDLRPAGDRKVLLCLRRDNETFLAPSERDNMHRRIPFACTYFDTTLSTSIAPEERLNELTRTLTLFRNSDIIITDRYHGLIFSILSKKPCIVLRTVDHKLTSAMHWFQGMPSVIFSENIQNIPGLIEKHIDVPFQDTCDWNAKYFDCLPEQLNLETQTRIVSGK